MCICIPGSYSPTREDLQRDRIWALQRVNQGKASINALEQEIQKLSWWNFLKKITLKRKLREMKRSLLQDENSVRYYDNELSRFS